MKITFLFVLALAVSQATAMKRPLGSKQKLAVLAELDSRPIGNMIMSQLQIHLAAEGVVDDVVNLVASLIAELNDEQVAADRTHNQDVITCDEQLGTTWSKHEQHQSEAQACDEAETDTEHLLHTAEEELGSTIENVKNLERLIEEGTALRATQAKAHGRSMIKHQKAIDALTEAIKIIGAFQSGGSWIQLKSKVEKVAQVLQDIQQLQEFDAFGPMISSLVQMTATTEGDAVGEILNLLKAIREDIEKTVVEETALEDSRMAVWNKELATMTVQRNNGISRKGVLETNIDNYHGIIRDNVASAAMHREEQMRFLDLHQNWQTDCDGRFAAYDKGTKDRQADLEVLGRLAEYMAEQVGDVEDYLMERVNV